MHPDAYPQPLFKNQTKCRDLGQRLLTKLAKIAPSLTCHCDTLSPPTSDRVPLATIVISPRSHQTASWCHQRSIRKEAKVCRRASTFACF
jgi:hypothetical protein